MFYIENGKIRMAINFAKGYIESFEYDGNELLSGHAPIFSIALRRECGDAVALTPSYAAGVRELPDGAEYYGFDNGISVRLTVVALDDGFNFGLSIKNQGDLAIEYAEYPNIALKPLCKNGGKGKIV